MWGEEVTSAMRRSMSHAAALSLGALSAFAGCGRPEPPPILGPAGPRRTISFTGTVKSVDVLHTDWEQGPDGRLKRLRIFGPPGLPMIVVDDVLSRWAVTVHVDPAGEPNDLVEAGKETVLAIHSPVQVFHTPGEEAVGRRYRFELSHEELILRDGSKMRSYDLSAREAAW